LRDWTLPRFLGHDDARRRTHFFALCSAVAERTADRGSRSADKNEEVP
jgi:hypothetical protein